MQGRFSLSLLPLEGWSPNGEAAPPVLPFGHEMLRRDRLNPRAQFGDVLGINQPALAEQLS